MKDIIDVSRYQGVINWERLKDQIGGAMLRAVSTSSRMGGVYIDPTFERNAAHHCAQVTKLLAKRLL